MTPDQATAIVGVIGDLWSITTQPPEKGGYSPRMVHELKDKLRKHSYEAAEAILSAMRFEPGNQVRPALDKLIARLNDVKRAEGVERNDGRVEREADRENCYPISNRRAHYNKPENFATMSEAAKKGCRWVWGEDYGTGAELLDTAARRASQEKLQAMHRADESQRTTRLEQQRGKVKDARRRVVSCMQQPWPETRDQHKDFVK